MQIDLQQIQGSFRLAHEGKQSRHSVSDRIDPSWWQYDYLTLSRLSRDIRALLARVPAARNAMALDLGSEKSPYRKELAARGYEVRTLDISRDNGADYAGTAERTGLPDASFDLVLCTQVIEHCMNPWAAVREMHRILRPGGHAILSAPHVWFYHPHPTDHWRYTQEGMAHLCREAGLEPVALLAQGGSVLTLFQVLNFLCYGVLGKAGTPLYSLLNFVGSVGDRLAPNQLFCHNFACLARKPEARPVGRSESVIGPGYHPQAQ